MIFNSHNLKAKIEDFCLFSLSLVDHYKDDDILTDDHYKLIISKIDNIIDEVTESFNMSIITGEYITNFEFSRILSDYEIELDNSINKINLEFIQSPVLNPNIILQNISKVKEMANTFQRFLENVYLKFKFHEKRFYVNESLFNKFSKLQFDDSNHKVNLFYANLFIAQCDHFVSNTDDKSLIKLDQIIELFANKTDIDTITDKVYRKAYFLRHKITLRFVEEYKSDDNSSQIYVSKNGKNQIFQPSEVLTESYLSDFKSWNEYLLTHYELFDDWKNRIRTTSSTVNDFSNLSVLDLHRLIKYAKDVLNNTSLIVQVREEIKRRLLVATSPINIYAFKICLSYSYNNEFSFLVQSVSPNNIKIKELYNEIKECAELAEIKNYFVPALLLTHNVQNLKKYFENKTVIDNIKICEKLIVECNELIKLYNDGINWVKENYNYIFQLPMNECLVDLNDNSKMFVFSSCFLPISRNTLELKFKNDLENFYIYKASIENLLITNKGIIEIKELTEEFEKKETKALETIVIVSAIMTFVAASIPGFKFINTGLEAIYFTLSLGSSLALFSIVFYGLNRGMDKLKPLKIPLIIGAIVVLILWSLLYFFTKNNLNFKEEDPNKINIENTIDLKHQNNALNIDSLNIEN